MVLYANQNGPTIALIAGEYSGDACAAKLIQALRKKIPNARFVGMTGPAMEEVGCESLARFDDISVMGILAVFKKLPKILSIRRQLIKRLVSINPDVCVGVDFTSFNVSLGLKLRQRGMKFVQYKGPSVWAYGAFRVKKVAKLDKLLTIFPFEDRFYDTYPEVRKCYIGHALADDIKSEVDIQARALVNQTPVVAIMPGSRMQELKALCPLFLKVAKKLHQTNPNINWRTSLVNEKHLDFFQSQLSQIAPELVVDIELGQSHKLLQQSDGVLLCSGTATLEAMLLYCPMVVAYRYPKIYDILAKPFVRIKYISLPNLISDQPLVSECIQEECTEDKLAKELEHILFNKEVRLQHINHYQRLHNLIKCDANERAATEIIKTIHA